MINRGLFALCCRGDYRRIRVSARERIDSDRGKSMNVPSAQIPGVYHRRIGDIVVTAISDGYLDGAYEFMRNVEPPEAERYLKEAFRPAPPRISINTFLIHSAGRIALVDTGSQHSMGPTLGHMPKHIAAA